MNNVLAYFATAWNADVDPGNFVWAPGVGNGPLTNPQRSNQIFEEFMDGESLEALTKPVNGTNITAVAISATTIDNDAYGIVAGQNISILLLNLNSNVPTFLITTPMIDAYTPAVVGMVEAIASSQDLADVVNSFVTGDGDMHRTFEPTRKPTTIPEDPSQNSKLTLSPTSTPVDNPSSYAQRVALEGSLLFSLVPALCFIVM